MVSVLCTLRILSDWFHERQSESKSRKFWSTFHNFFRSAVIIFLYWRMFITTLYPKPTVGAYLNLYPFRAKIWKPQFRKIITVNRYKSCNIEIGMPTDCGHMTLEIWPQKRKWNRESEISFGKFLNPEIFRQTTHDVISHHDVKQAARGLWRLACRDAGTLVYRSLTGTAPVYLADKCTLVTVAGCRPLRSADNRTCLVKRSHNQFSDRCFATTGPTLPTLWNSLPEQTRQLQAKT